MARLPYLDVADLKEEDRELLTRPINLYRILVHSPEAARRFSAMGSWIRYGTALDPRLREMAILQVGYMARAPYEWSHHVKISHDFGVTDDDIRAIIAESSGETSALPELDRTVLRLARDMSEEIDGREEDVATVREALGEEHLVDLVLTIAFYSAVVRFLGTFAIDVEPEYQPYLDQFPLPSR